MRAAGMNERILLIEDDEELGAQIVGHLRKAGYEPTWWRRGIPLDPGFASSLHLLILDLMLPGSYGMDILKELREVSEVPVLILSARNDTFEKVRALKLGADDYMTKPFWPEELVERARARLRRPALQKEGAVEIGALKIDLSVRAVTVHGGAIDLTRVEFDLLAALARRAGTAISRRWLVDNVLDPDREGTERTLDVHISRLRKKLGRDNHIETVWGIGYRLEASDP
jgi:two-component system response regulator MtrA